MGTALYKSMFCFSSTDSQQRTQMKTRAQLKNERQQESKSSSATESEAEEPKMIEDEEETLKVPSISLLESAKHTVSFGCGSVEGAQKSAEIDGHSFAPVNFDFTSPMDIGSFHHVSKTFKFQPLSPASAEKFMFPSFNSFFSPERSEKRSEPIHEGNNKSAGDAVMKTIQESVTEVEHELQCKTGTLAEVDPSQDMETDHPDKLATDNRDTKPDQLEAKENDEAKQVSSDHDAEYFRNLLKSETEKLNKACENWEKIDAEKEELSEEGTVCY